MSVKVKKPGLIISWHRSFSILTPWKKGKSNAHPVPDSEVVLTKMKFLNNFHQKLLNADDTISKICCEQESTKASEMDSPPDERQTESSSRYISAIFSKSQLPRLYKFESEDSGVELPSGANSPSTPSASEQSFVVHSRESSCDSCNSKSDSALLPYTQNSETRQTEDLVDISVAANTQELHPEQDSSSTITGDVQEGEDIDKDQIKALGINPEGGEELPEKPGQKSAVTERSCFQHPRERGQECAEMTGDQFEPGPSTSESLEEYMAHCCRISESQRESCSPLGSGLGYLQHICHLMERISQLQEANLRLQRQLCSLQKDARGTKTKEEFFQQHCSCGAASLAFQDVQKRQARSVHLSPGVTVSDLSIIHEVIRRPLRPRRDLSGEDLSPAPLSRRELNQSSYAEGEAHISRDGSEGPRPPQLRPCENYTWGRVKDLAKKTKLRNKSKLGLTSTSLKMSCPQLYMPDLGPDLACRQRNSMIALDHHRYDFLWQQ